MFSLDQSQSKSRFILDKGALFTYMVVDEYNSATSRMLINSRIVAQCTCSLLIIT